MVLRRHQVVLLQHQVVLLQRRVVQRQRRAVLLLLLDPRRPRAVGEIPPGRRPGRNER